MMKAKACRLKVVLLTLCAAVLSGNAARADWFYDFNDGKLPSTLYVQGITSDWHISTTLASSAQGGRLRLWDSMFYPPAGTGTAIGWAVDNNVFLDDLRISAQINPSGNGNDVLGLCRGGSPVDTSYGVKFSFNPAENAGQLAVWKMLPLGQLLELWTTEKVAELNRSYCLELQIVNDTTSGWPGITGRLLDQEGGMTLLEASFVDSNLGGIVYSKGKAGVFAYTLGSDVLDASFDNVRAVNIVPEPSSAVLLVMGAGGLAVCRWRRKRSR